MDATIFSYEIEFNTKDWIKIMIYDIAQTISIITSIIIILGYIFFINSKKSSLTRRILRLSALTHAKSVYVTPTFTETACSI